MEVVSCFSSCLERKINEAVRITSSKAEYILNSRSEFHQAPIIRQVVTHGLGVSRGRRRSTSGQGEAGGMKV